MTDQVDNNEKVSVLLEVGGYLITSIEVPIINCVTSVDIKKTLFIFGRDVSKIPCFRNSILYGIGGGLCSGLARFMFTSQPLKSVNFAVYSFSFITMVYWIQCRYKFSKTKFEMLRMQEMLQRHVLIEGTQVEEDVNLQNKPVDI